VSGTLKARWALWSLVAGQCVWRTWDFWSLESRVVKLRSQMLSCGPGCRPRLSTQGARDAELMEGWIRPSSRARCTHLSKKIGKGRSKWPITLFFFLLFYYSYVQHQSLFTTVHSEILSGGRIGFCHFFLLRSSNKTSEVLLHLYITMDQGHE
jgi:hypothetical protein